MTKKHFIELADAVRGEGLTDHQLYVLALFCANQNPNFNRGRWMAYIKGECGPNGGALPKAPTPRTLKPGTIIRKRLEHAK